jgi:hypothetical protein
LSDHEQSTCDQGTPDEQHDAERIPPALQPDEIADWIDEVEAALEQGAVEVPVDDVLEQQRAVHEPGAATAEVADDGISPLVNNTGQDGGAASG